MHFASKSAQVWCQGATCSSQLTRVSPRPLSWQGLPPRAASTCPVGAYAVASSQRQRPGFRPTPPTHTTQGPSPGPTHFPPPPNHRPSSSNPNAKTAGKQDPSPTESHPVHPSCVLVHFSERCSTPPSLPPSRTSPPPRRAPGSSGHPGSSCHTRTRRPSPTASNGRRFGVSGVVGRSRGPVNEESREDV